MSTLNFRLLSNSFASQTSDSHVKAVRLSTDSVDKLRVRTEPELVSIYTDYLPFHTSYINLHVAVTIADGTYKGKTLGFMDVLNTLPDKLRYWEPVIYSLFPEGSPTATEIFPQRRSPFYESSYENRLLAVKALRDKLLEYTPANAALVPVQADVAAFFSLADTTRQTQQGNEGNLSTLRLQREEQRQLTMAAFWGIVYGGLLRYYYTNPELILGIIDLHELYDNRRESISINGTLNSGQVVNINALLPDLNAEPTSVLKLKNNSSTTATVVFYAATSATELPGTGTQFTVAPGNVLEKSLADMGFADPYSYFNVYNPNIPNADWELEILL